ncbi:MAG: DNA-directed RNA polymerase subunit omega [Magnetococcales bacterium]|nr:DNA-directed RNA polymerase subunit omega [Magnetococcales bacterium]MBF0584485.1 DNA-directed RNA polymerase subunit omega [Magnetococcales bacterium]
MARVTIEDCLQFVPNRFDLVLLASKRARQLMAGSDPLLPLNNDKVTVIALRELAEGLLDLEALEKEPLERRGRMEEEYLPADAEARDLMNEEIHLPGVDEGGGSEEAEEEESTLDSLLGLATEDELDLFAGSFENAEEGED